MTDGYLKTGRVYDFKSHRDVVLNKTLSFIAIWFLFGLFTIISLIPIFWIIGLIFFIYFILIFQVFTFENGLSPFGYFRRSFELIKGHFGKTFLLTVILFIFTYHLLPLGFSVLSDALNITSTLSKFLEGWALAIPIRPIEAINFNPTPLMIAEAFIKQIIVMLIVGFTLPLRSICWTLWYNNLAELQDDKALNNTKSKNKKNTRRSKKELDPEILRRANLEDDEY